MTSRILQVRPRRARAPGRLGLSDAGSAGPRPLAAAVRVDALGALMLGVTSADWRRLYRSQFPVLLGYEHAKVLSERSPALRRLAPARLPPGSGSKPRRRRARGWVKVWDRVLQHIAGDTDVDLGPFVPPFRPADREAAMTNAYWTFVDRYDLTPPDLAERPSVIPSLVAGELKASIVEYLATTFALSDDETYEALTEFLLDKEDGIFRGPYLRVRLPFVDAPEDVDTGLRWTPPASGRTRIRSGVAATRRPRRGAEADADHHRDRLGQVRGIPDPGHRPLHQSGRPASAGSRRCCCIR